jgi:hypothetical protein
MSEGIERLLKLVEGQEDIALLKVVDYLSKQQEMDQKYLNEEKSLKSMIDYIKGEARKLSKNNYVWVEDDTVYKWAVNYWDTTDEELGIKKVPVTTPTKIKETKEVVPEIQKYGQLSLF